MFGIFPSVPGLVLRALTDIIEPPSIRRLITVTTSSPPAELREIRREIDTTRREIDAKRQVLHKMTRKSKKKDIKSFDDLSKRDKQRKRTLAKLARKTKATKRQGKNIAVFGKTSTGKSTVVNSLLGKEVAEVGVGETTKTKASYQGTRYTLWDLPGRNDELTYSDKKHISFIKGLTIRLIVIQSTIKENLDLMRLLDELKLDYDIVVNKLDNVREHEQEKFQRQIKREITSSELKRNKNVFFVSARNPRMFPDWLKLVDYLTEECIDYGDHTTRDTNTNSDSSATSDSDSSSTSDSDSSATSDSDSSVASDSDSSVASDSDSSSTSDSDSSSTSDSD